MRTCPSAPKASPGTTVTCSCCRRRAANSRVSRTPSSAERRGHVREYVESALRLGAYDSRNFAYALDDEVAAKPLQDKETLKLYLTNAQCRAKVLLYVT
jgi:hypothetical protein